MTTKLLHAAAAAALLLAGAARADDAQQPAQVQPPMSDAARAAMHEAMQHQMATPPMGSQMPAQMPAQTPTLPDRASATATRALDHAAEVREQHRAAARERAMKRGAQDAELARAGAMHGSGATPTRHAGSGAGHNGMMDDSSAQQGAGMRRTGDMHGGTDGMMPSGGGMTGGGHGTMGATAPGSGTPTAPTAPTGGGMMTK